MSRPLREATTYLVLAFSLAIGIATALPHAGINVLLSAFAPITALVIITFTVTPRGRRRALWGEFGLDRSGKRLWAFAVLVPMLLAGSAYGAALGAGRRGPAPGRPDVVGVGVLEPEPGERGAGIHDRPLPGQGDRLAGLPPAEDPASHQPSPGCPGHRLHPRLLPPAADPHRHDVRRARQPLARGAGRGRHDHHGWRLLRLRVGPDAQRLARGDGARCSQHRVRYRCGRPWWRASEADLAYVAGESGIATFAAVAVVGVLFLARARVWRSTRPAAVEVRERELARAA